MVDCTLTSFAKNKITVRTRSYPWMDRSVENGTRVFGTQARKKKISLRCAAFAGAISFELLNDFTWWSQSLKSPKYHLIYRSENLDNTADLEAPFFPIGSWQLSQSCLTSTAALFSEWTVQIAPIIVVGLNPAIPVNGSVSIGPNRGKNWTRIGWDLSGGYHQLRGKLGRIRNG